MDVRTTAAIIALLCLFAGWVVGREASYGPMADRLMICEQGLDTCGYGLTRCGAELGRYERWATEARERRLSGKGVGVGPIGR